MIKIETMLWTFFKIFKVLLTKSAWSSITKCHGRCHLNSKHLFHTVLDSQKSKITVVTGLVLGERSLPGLRMASLLSAPLHDGEKEL